MTDVVNASASAVGAATNVGTAALQPLQKLLAQDLQRLGCMANTSPELVGMAIGHLENNAVDQVRQCDGIIEVVAVLRFVQSVTTAVEVERAFRDGVEAGKELPTLAA